MYQKIIMGLFLVLLGVGLAQAEVQVFSQLEPKNFAEDQASRLTLTVQGANAAEPKIPAIEGLRFRFLGQKMHSQWINGQHSASISFTYLVEAAQAGSYTIAPLQVEVQGKVYTAPDLTCTVAPAQGTGRAGQQAAPSSRLPLHEVEEIGFMQMSLPQTQVYVGQLLPFTFKAYFRPGMRINIKSNPRFVGEHFLLHSLDQEPLQMGEEVNGEFYIALTWEGKLSAVKEGQLNLSAEIDAELLLRERRGGMAFDLDDFFGDAFAPVQRRDFTVSSPAKVLEVQALPRAGRPADFHGAVGNFSLAVALHPTEGQVGDPLTLTMKLTGQGNFNQVQPPSLTDSEGWRLYPATARVERREKIFEQALVPLRQDIEALPPLVFSYFDPVVQDYVSLHSDPIPLNIHGTDAQETPAPAAQPVEEEQQAAPRQRLAPPKLNPGEMVQQIEPVYAQLWFILLALGAGCCLGLGLVLDFRRRKRFKNPHHFFVKQMEQEVKQHLSAMRVAAQAADQEKFRWHGLRAIQKQASTVLDIKPEAVTQRDVINWLEGKNMALVEIFAQLEQSGYAGVVLTGEAMERICTILEEQQS